MRRQVNNSIYKFQMMADSKIKFCVCALSTVLSLPAMAQMDNTVEVETSVTPIVKDANKINVLPEVVETESKHNAVQYSTAMLQTKKYVFTPVDMLSTEFKEKGARKGFLSLGGGVPGVLDVRGAYGIDLSKNDVLGFRISSNGFKGKADNKDLGTEYKSRFYTTRGAVDYTHKFAKGLSEFYVKYGMESQVFNYQFPVNPETDKQHCTLGDVKIGTTDIKSKNWRFNGELSYKFFNQKYTTNMEDKYSESVLDAQLSTGYYFNEENSLNIDLALMNSSYSMQGVNGITHFSCVPYYKYEDYDMLLKVGLYIDTDGIAPDVRFNYHFSEYTDFYAQVIGYDIDNNFRYLNSLNPYAYLPVPAKDTEYKLSSEFHQLDCKLGIKFRSDGGFGGDINLGYEMADDRAEFSTVYVEDLNKNSLAKNPEFTFVKGNRFYANLDLVYNYKDKFKFDLKNQFNSWGVKGEDENGVKNSDKIAYARPTLDLDWNFEFGFGSGFFMGLDWKLQTFKKSSDYKENGLVTKTAYKRPTTCDLGLTAHYRFQKVPLSIYANVDNLLNSKYDRFYGYRAIGTNFILGVAFTF